MSQKLENSYIAKRLREIGLDFIERLPQRKIKYRCVNCGRIKEGYIDNLLSKKKTMFCSDCNHRTKKSTDDYIAEIETKNIPVEVMGEYINALTPINHKCKICGHVWNVTPAHILSSRKCPICSYSNIGFKKRPQNKKYSFDEVSEILKKKNIKLIELYVDGNNKTRCKCECLVDGYKYESPLSHIINGTSCPCCKKQKIGPEPHFVNSVFSSNYYEIFKKGFSDDVLKEVMPFSEKKIKGTCPKCGRNIETYPALIVQLGKIPCPCSDGISYPNKFVYNILEQSGINFIREYSPKWFGRKRRSYDFFLPNENAIIEVNGLQHYQNVFERLGGRTIEKEQENDLFKKECALKNGVEKYIELDCSFSNVEYIKKSVMSNKEFLKLIKKDNIDFDRANNFAINDSVIQNIARDVNYGKTRNEICAKYHISMSMYYKYLHNAIELKLCEDHFNSKQKIMCVENKKIYDSYLIAGKDFSIRPFHIKEVCDGKRKTAGGYHWIYINTDS